VREQLECMELCLGMDDEPMEHLWVRKSEQTSTGDVVVGVYYGLTDQEEQVDEAFYRELEAALQTPQYLRTDYTAGHKQSRSVLENIDDKFLSQVKEEPMRRVCCTEPHSQNKEGLLGMIRSKAVIMRWWSSRFQGQGEGQKASSQHWTSGEQTAALPKICLEKSHGTRPGREGDPRKLIFKDHLL